MSFVVENTKGGAEQADCENSVSRYMATSSLGPRVSTINHWNIAPRWDVPMV
jgi:hypothetical protein